MLAGLTSSEATPPWLVSSCLLPGPSHGPSSVGVCSQFPLFGRTPVILDYIIKLHHSTLITSRKDTSPNTVILLGLLGGEGFNIWMRGNAIHP